MSINRRESFRCPGMRHLTCPQPQHCLASPHFQAFKLLQYPDGIHRGSIGCGLAADRIDDIRTKSRAEEHSRLRQIGEHYGVDLSGIWFVGDSIGDLEAARAVRAAVDSAGISLRAFGPSDR